MKIRGRAITQERCTSCGAMYSAYPNETLCGKCEFERKRVTYTGVEIANPAWSELGEGGHRKRDYIVSQYQ